MKLRPESGESPASAKKRRRTPRATIDFETRSPVDIKAHGSWVYSRDPRTEVLCLQYKLPGQDEVKLWHGDIPEGGFVAMPMPDDLISWIEFGGIVEAHNASFEQNIWENIMVARFGWPAVPRRQWRCSAAKAAAFALPRGLDGCGRALRAHVQKSQEGKKLMLKLAKPRKPRKAEVKAFLEQGLTPDQFPILWAGTREEFLGLFDYCRTDVEAEEAISEILPDLNEHEQEVWFMDQTVNRRGFTIDKTAVHAALKLIKEIAGDATDELPRLTDGQVTAPTQRAKIVEWVSSRGYDLPNTQGATLDEWLLRTDLPKDVYTVIEICRSGGRSSTAKFNAMEAFADREDWRVRGGIIYHGASTGRWTGAGVQPHNFPRGSIKNMELAWEVLRDMDPDWIQFLYYDAMEVLSHALRGAITAGPGKVLYVADYAAIEARVVFWLAEDDHALGIFRRGECIYCDMATTIYGRQIIKGIHLDERQMGKQAVLGLGYQMGAQKFMDTCAKYGIIITLEFAKKVVDLYREKYEKVKRMWWAQEEAAIAAVKTPGRVVRCGRVRWRYQGKFLYCKLPSGRNLAYAEPIVVQRETPWGAMKDMLTFMGVDSYSKQWVRQSTYGGTLVENITQAVARDLMADAKLRVEASGTYEVLLSVHDEIIAEADVGTGNVKEFESLISETPAWAEGCPVAAEGWSAFRYKK